MEITNIELSENAAGIYSDFSLEKTFVMAAVSEGRTMQYFAELFVARQLFTINRAEERVH